MRAIVGRGHGPLQQALMKERNIPFVRCANLHVFQ